jgi:protein-S-isoprenylcysteine O-methyltransferase Ste14
MSPSDPQNINDDESSRRVSEMTLVELGEKLFQWRDYIALPILMILLLAGSPTARTATIGTLMIIAGQVIRIYTVSFLGEDGASRDGQTERIISHGPFAIIRNPLYAGNMTIIVGVVIYLGSVIFGLLALGYFAFQYHCIVKYEESLLLAKYGDEYQRYMERVPAWIPIKLPTIEDFPVPTSISQAIYAERKPLATMGVLLFLLLLSAK